MRRGRPKAALALTPTEKCHLESLAKATAHEDGVSKRAKIVLLCAEGLENREVARRLATSAIPWAGGARSSWWRACADCTMPRAEVAGA